MTIDSNDYDFLSALVARRSGLALGSGKEYLLEARLIPIANSLGMPSLVELVRHLRVRRDENLEATITEAMTTNETLFFRDKTPFDELKEQILPELITNRQTSRRLRIWSAAASTGQEAYSLLMTIRESFPQLSSWRIEVIGTDISQQALSKARQGTYSQFEVQRGLPIQLLVKYFQQVPEGWQISQELRNAVTFKPLNLLENLSSLGEFDIIFCRNVLIYFEQANKTTILDRMERQLRPDGYLVLGAAETVLGVTNRFQRVRSCKSAVYAPSRQFQTV
ncbi:Protein-glutamate O-methyltransferase [Planctopirus limnophila DSM 3776]|uniref:protein-glutamate O-methyltransferase n=1 Tax=Planctopirus limnophila (strain ATCC 43296 / DSM 3776 / IFAM 1008 / Mu 290) TaxID=521674 RepID=D5SYL4_PLAL2|nr:protein-glutamate O-methyltransferase CheR [Planctopirus limnophila]ADG67742.1 Protein-glutamate O-methyltransferase [Planctopirus limnophila DSM 3776]